MPWTATPFVNGFVTRFRLVRGGTIRRSAWIESVDIRAEMPTVDVRSAAADYRTTPFHIGPGTYEVVVVFCVSFPMMDLIVGGEHDEVRRTMSSVVEALTAALPSIRVQSMYTISPHDPFAYIVSLEVAFSPLPMELPSREAIVSLLSSTLSGVGIDMRYPPGLR